MSGRAVALVTAVVCALAAIAWAIRITPLTLGAGLPVVKTASSTPSPPPAPGFASDGTRIFSVEELATFDGEASSTIYISVLGHVFDVTAGKQHYLPKRSYHHFAGRDASRSFVTGDTKLEKLTDDISGLDDEELEGIAGWYTFYDEHEVYRRVGRLVGRYYDPATGEAVEPFPFERLSEAKELAERRKQAFPSCNSKWSQADGSEVWCTTKSGGISRNWVGVPRLYKPEGSTDRERCACVQPGRAQPSAELKVYPGCAKAAERCKVEAKSSGNNE